VTMPIRPIGTRRQMETQKFRDSYRECRTPARDNARATIRAGEGEGGELRAACAHRMPPSVLVIFTRQTISRGIESSGFIIRENSKITGRAFRLD